MAKNVKSTNQKGGITADTVNISNSTDTNIGNESNNNEISKPESDVGSKPWKLLGKLAIILTIVSGIIAILVFIGLSPGE